MKTSKLLIQNINTGKLPKKEADKYTKIQHKKSRKSLNLPKHVKLVTQGYDNSIQHKPLFEVIDL